MQHKNFMPKYRIPISHIFILLHTVFRCDWRSFSLRQSIEFRMFSTCRNSQLNFSSGIKNIFRAWGDAWCFQSFPMWHEGPAPTTQCANFKPGLLLWLLTKLSPSAADPYERTNAPFPKSKLEAYSCFIPFPRLPGSHWKNPCRYTNCPGPRKRGKFGGFTSGAR